MKGKHLFHEGHQLHVSIYIYNNLDDHMGPAMAQLKLNSLPCSTPSTCHKVAHLPHLVENQSLHSMQPEAETNGLVDNDCTMVGLQDCGLTAQMLLSRVQKSYRIVVLVQSLDV